VCITYYYYELSELLPAINFTYRDLYLFNVVDFKLDVNQRVRNSQFLHKELPIRLAQR